ncbi:coiled-coil domain-containing protein 30 isoform X2 [Myiozetetes cayanensis]|uniref:coiled-coil domain-containing protein 30 isoform X2 n=1 Tax=Myiozetetes cayanensis TaxID=478635 RepID=UPI00215DF687|nr:coiled-coil domain-containing protein 30 isoform X2 [Myiozetetes cayanensis]
MDAAAAAAPAEPPVPADAVLRWLRAEGADPAAPAQEQLGLAWRLLRKAETRLGELERRREQDMRDVESYVGHVRALTEERDAIASEYEKENEQLRLELARLQLLQEAQLKEVEEMLEQEGLSQIAHSAASEQVAYLLVERTALLGKLGLLHSTTQGIQFCREELEREPAGAVGELGEAPQRLMVAQEELQGMTEGLDAPSEEQSGAGRTELQEAMEHNSRLDKEILALRARVQTLDLERKAFLELVEQLKEEICEYQRSERLGPSLPEEPGAASLQGTRDEGRAEDERGAGRAWSSSDQEERDPGGETLHKRCREVMENMEGRNSQLLHKLQKLEQEHEDLVERNEELESILGETQIQTKQEKEQFESEVEGLQQKISSLETELLEVQKSKSETDRKEQAASGAQEMQEGFSASLSELPSHGNTSPALQRTSASRDLMDVSHEKHKDSALLDPEASEILQDREQSHRVEQTQEDPHGDAKTYEEQMAKVVFLEEQVKSLREEQELLCSELLESNKKKEELEKQLKESNEEKRMLLEEISQLKRNIQSAREQGDPGETWRMNPGLEQRESRFLPWQSSAGSSDGSLKQAVPEEKFQQQEEKLQQLRQDLRRVQNLCSSAERELRYEREKNAELQKQNLLLQQECTKVKAELKQARAKLSDSTETCSSLSAQWERSQQKVRELEQELSKCSQADKLQSSLRDRLAQEKSRAGEAQKKISKLQQKLKDSQQQLLLAEARVSDKKLLEEELKEARENEARVRRELHEGQLKRKLLEQQVEDLRQQLRHSRETEASLARMHVELQAKTLHALEDERKPDPAEYLQCRKENQKLSEQLSLLKEENKALYDEGVRLLNQKDLYVRKYNEMQLRHKDKIRRAKETFIHEVKQRDSRIKQLENELSESKLQVEKGKVLIAQITAENEKLLQERRRLLQKISEQEEPLWSLRSVTAPSPSRGKTLEEENKLQLSGHVPASPRIPRSSPAPSAEDSKTLHVSEHQLQSKVVPLSRASFPPRDLPEPFSAMKAPQDTKPEGEAQSQDSSLGLSPSQPSEQGYLNVASPGDPAGSPLQEERRSIGSETF